MKETRSPQCWESGSVPRSFKMPTMVCLLFTAIMFTLQCTGDELLNWRPNRFGYHGGSSSFNITVWPIWLPKGGSWKTFSSVITSRSRDVSKSSISWIFTTVWHLAAFSFKSTDVNCRLSVYKTGRYSCRNDKSMRTKTPALFTNLPPSSNEKGQVGRLVEGILKSKPIPRTSIAQKWCKKRQAGAVDPPQDYLPQTVALQVWPWSHCRQMHTTLQSIRSSWKRCAWQFKTPPRGPPYLDPHSVTEICLNSLSVYRWRKNISTLPYAAATSILRALVVTFISPTFPPPKFRCTFLSFLFLLSAI